MNTLCIEPASDVRWQRLAAQPRASLFHSPPWARALSESYGFGVRAWIAMDVSGEPVAGVAFCRTANLAGPRVVCLPFSDYCDPLVTRREEWEALFAELRREGVPITLRCLGSEILGGDDRLVTVKRARCHALDLGRSLDSIWGSLDGPARRAIRKAVREGVVVERVDDEAFLKEFSRMHLAVRKYKYRLFAQPYGFFEAICRQFREVDGWFPLVALHRGRPVAATIFLRWGNTLYYKFNASDAETLSLRPNDLLVWAGIRLGQDLGCRRLDFGLSDDDQPGLIRFKRQFGTREEQISFLHHVGNADGDCHAEMLELLRELTRLFTDPAVPDELTVRASTVLYRLFA